MTLDDADISIYRGSCFQKGGSIDHAQVPVEGLTGVEGEIPIYDGLIPCDDGCP